MEYSTSAKTEMYKMYQEGNIQGDTLQLENSFELSDTYYSGLGYNNSQIEYMYNYMTNDKDANGNSVSTQRLKMIEAYKTMYGENEDNTSGIYTIDDKREMYKHILSTEKYNFNKIKWMNYSHTNTSGTEISKDSLYKNTDLGIMYPNDSSTDVQTYMNMVSPYLLSNVIPLSFLSATVTVENSYDESIPSSQQQFEELYGVESTVDSEAEYQKKANFAYEIIKYGMSDITVDQYQLKEYIETTKYDVYEAKTYYDTFDVTIRYVTNSDGTVSSNVSNTSNFKSNLVKTENINTRLDENGVEQKSKEERVSEDTNYENIYYLSYVKAFDIVRNFSYTYTPYSDEDVSTRTSSNEEVVTETYAPAVVNENHKVDSNNITQGKDNSTDIANLYGGTVVSTGQPVYDQNSSTNYSITYSIKSGEYTVNDGDSYYTTRSWKDTVTPGASTTSELKDENILDFNENKENDSGKTTVDRNVLASHEDMEHYRDLISDKKLNVIDILDSNPGIFSRYLPNGYNQSDYIGYGRTGSGSIILFGYDNLKLYLDEIAEENVLPFAYGSSLGYQTALYTQLGSYSGTAGFGSLDCITDRENPNISEEEKQKLLAEMASSGYRRASMAAQYGAWTIQYYKNYPSEIIARILMAELSGLSESEPSVYLVAAHALAIVKYCKDNYGSIDAYRYCLDGQITISSAACNRMNQVPPQFYREIATAAVRETLPNPPGFTGNESHWIGPADTTSNATYDWYQTTTSTCGYVATSSIWHAFQLPDGSGFDQKILPISGVRYLLNEQYKISQGVYVNPSTGASTTRNYDSIKKAMDDAYIRMTGSVTEGSGLGYTNTYTVAGKVYKEYKQDLFPRGTYRYWGGDVASIGCNVTSVCVIASAYNESVKNMDYYCGPNGRYRNGPIGTATEIQSIVNATTYINAGGDSTQKIIDNLSAGRPVVIHELASKGSHFTSSQHWMVLLDIKNEGGQTQVYLSTVNTGRKTGWYEVNYALAGLEGYIMILE